MACSGRYCSDGGVGAIAQRAGHVLHVTQRRSPDYSGIPERRIQECILPPTGSSFLGAFSWPRGTVSTDNTGLHPTSISVAERVTVVYELTES